MQPKCKYKNICKSEIKLKILHFAEISLKKFNAEPSLLKWGSLLAFMVPCRTFNKRLYIYSEKRFFRLLTCFTLKVGIHFVTQFSNTVGIIHFCLCKWVQRKTHVTFFWTQEMYTEACAFFLETWWHDKSFTAYQYVHTIWNVTNSLLRGVLEKQYFYRVSGVCIQWTLEATGEELWITEKQHN